MANRIAKTLALISAPRTVKSLLSLRFSGYLCDAGWFESARRKQSVDQAEHPIPWFTYPFNDFLLPRLAPDMHVFEFGGGASTLYLMKHCASVTTVEHEVFRHRCYGPWARARP